MRADTDRGGAQRGFTVAKPTRGPSVWLAAAGVPMLLAACAGYGPPPGYAGESWHRHVHRCLRAYPRYDPRTDLIERPGGPVRCPL